MVFTDMQCSWPHRGLGPPPITNRETNCKLLENLILIWYERRKMSKFMNALFCLTFKLPIFTRLQSKPVQSPFLFLHALIIDNCRPLKTARATHSKTWLKAKSACSGKPEIVKKKNRSSQQLTHWADAAARLATKSRRAEMHPQATIYSTQKTSPWPFKSKRNRPRRARVDPGNRHRVSNGALMCSTTQRLQQS